jgi:hypothetical protein
MIAFKDKLEKICNYSEENKTMASSAQIMYVDFVYENEEIKREEKRKKRNLAIDTVLDEIEENGDYSESNLSQWGDDTIGGFITPQMMTMNVSAQNYKDNEFLYNNVINFLEKNTKQKHNSPLNLDYVAMNDPHKTLEENNNINFRKILTKIMFASNFIATEGRIGTATSVIVGRNNWRWFNGDFNIGIDIIFDENITNDKIIVCRGSSQNKPGLILVNNILDNTYYFKETPNWERQYVWFTIK